MCVRSPELRGQTASASQSPRGPAPSPSPKGTRAQQRQAGQRRHRTRGAAPARQGAEAEVILEGHARELGHAPQLRPGAGGTQPAPAHRAARPPTRSSCRARQRRGSASGFCVRRQARAGAPACVSASTTAPAFPAPPCRCGRPRPCASAAPRDRRGPRAWGGRPRRPDRARPCPWGNSRCCTVVRGTCWVAVAGSSRPRRHGEGEQGVRPQRGVARAVGAQAVGQHTIPVAVAEGARRSARPALAATGASPAARPGPRRCRGRRSTAPGSPPRGRRGDQASRPAMRASIRVSASAWRSRPSASRWWRSTPSTWTRIRSRSVAARPSSPR